MRYVPRAYDQSKTPYLQQVCRIHLQRFFWIFQSPNTENVFEVFFNYLEKRKYSNSIFPTKKAEQLRGITQNIRGSLYTSFVALLS